MGTSVKRPRLYAIECNPRAHTAVVLFANTGNALGRDDLHQLTDAYLDASHSSSEASQAKQEATTSQTPAIIVPPVLTRGRYWLAHDLVILLVLPLTSMLRLRMSPVGFIRHLAELFGHITTWKEGTFEFWDPMPFLVLYHVYWPLVLLKAWVEGKRWSKINVSTTKMFML
jgi:hypothetical protein